MIGSLNQQAKHRLSYQVGGCGSGLHCNGAWGMEYNLQTVGFKSRGFSVATVIGCSNSQGISVKWCTRKFVGEIFDIHVKADSSELRGVSASAVDWVLSRPIRVCFNYCCKLCVVLS